MATEVDGAGLYMDVHQVVHNLALDVVLDAVGKETPANINNLDEGQVPDGREGEGWPSETLIG